MRQSLLKIINFPNQKHEYLIYSWSYSFVNSNDSPCEIYSLFKVKIRRYLPPCWLGKVNRLCRRSLEITTESEFNEFNPRLKSPKNRIQSTARLKSWKNEYNSKWNQPYLSRGSNSFNSASVSLILLLFLDFRRLHTA